MSLGAINSSSLVRYARTSPAGGIASSSLQQARPARPPSSEKAQIPSNIAKYESIKLISRLPMILQTIVWPFLLLADMLKDGQCGSDCYFIGSSTISKEMPDREFFYDLCHSSSSRRQRALRKLIDVDAEMTNLVSPDYYAMLRKTNADRCVVEKRIKEVDTSINKRCALGKFLRELEYFRVLIGKVPPGPHKIYIAKRLLARICGPGSIEKQQSFLSKSIVYLQADKVERRFAVFLYRKYLTNPGMRNTEGVEYVRALAMEHTQQARSILISLQGILEIDGITEAMRCLPDYSVRPLFSDESMFPGPY